MKSLGRILLVASVLLLFCTEILRAQSQPSEHKTQQVAVVQGETFYRKWLDEDVVYIITSRESDDFARLASDQERDRFIKEFWQRRNPIPGSEQNPFRTEYYRRLAYANRHFAFPGTSGWKSDRGRTYIIYGPPDEREQHPNSANLPNNRLDTLQSAIDLWRYQNIDGIGQDITFKFIDDCRCGEYRLENDPALKPAPIGTDENRSSL